MEKDKISRLEQAREHLGYNKSEFAELMGISRHYYYHILSGKGTNNLRIEHLEALYLKVRLNPLWILTGEGVWFLKSNEPVNKITSDDLLAAISIGWPQDWQKYWIRRAAQTVCEKITTNYPDMPLVEMKNAALSAVASLSLQILGILESSAAPGQQINLVLDGEEFQLERSDLEQSTKIPGL